MDVGGVLIASAACRPTQACEKLRGRRGKQTQRVPFVDHLSFGSAKQKSTKTLVAKIGDRRQALQPRGRNNGPSEPNRTMGHQGVPQNVVASFEKEPVTKFMGRVLDGGTELSRRRPPKHGSEKAVGCRVVTRPRWNNRQGLARPA